MNVLNHLENSGLHAERRSMGMDAKQAAVDCLIVYEDCGHVVVYEPLLLERSSSPLCFVTVVLVVACCAHGCMHRCARV